MSDTEPSPEQKHLASCALNQALIDRWRQTGDWRLLGFARTPDRWRSRPVWYEGNEELHLLQGQADRPELLHPCAQALELTWMGPTRRQRNSFAFAVGPFAVAVVVPPVNLPSTEQGEAGARLQAGQMVRQLHEHLLTCQDLALHLCLQARQRLAQQPKA